MRNGVSVRWVAASTVVTSSCGAAGLSWSAWSVASRSAVARSEGEARSYGRQSQAGKERTRSSGAKYAAVSATPRISRSSAATYTARRAGAQARARSASSQGRKPGGTAARVSGEEASRMRARLSVKSPLP